MLVALAGVTLGSTACMADPPPPQEATAVEIAASDGLKVGFTNPQPTEEEGQVQMDAGVCKALVTHTGGVTVANLSYTPSGEHRLPDPLPPREELQRILTTYGC